MHGLNERQISHVVQYCANEVARQEDIPFRVFHMFEAWRYAAKMDEEMDKGSRGIFECDIKSLNGLIVGAEMQTEYRRTPVTFRNMAVIGWEEIERQMKLLVDEGNDPTSHLELDEWMKAFLDIHPFEDGNGRVASLIYNVKNGTILEPVTMPNYYSEG